MAKNEVFFGDYRISVDSYPYLIAEIGINHNGDMQIAKRLIDAAFSTGWHSVKFQKRDPDLAVPDHQKNVMRQTPWGEMTYLDYKKHIEFGNKQYDYIDKYCREKPIAWSASPWDIPSLTFLLQYDVPFIKIASACLTNDELLKEACASGKSILMSTGMSTWSEIDHAVDILDNHAKGNYVLMHTNSSYPSPHEDINLRMINTLQERYRCIVGYSGHEDDLVPAAAATALGAKVIERHITVDRHMWGTDQASSLAIRGMDNLAMRINTIYKALGDGKLVLSEEQLKMKEKLRK